MGVLQGELNGRYEQLLLRMTMRKGAIPILLLACAFVAMAFSNQTSLATSRTIVVPSDYPTISEAIKNASPGDAILVKNGIYRERSLEINKTLSLIGENANETIIQNIDNPPPWTIRHPFLRRLQMPS